METARCRAFLAAAETGSFSKAAEALSYTPSGVNQLVSALEKEVGFSLFSRSTKGVALTANGQLLLPVIREILHQEDRLFELSAQMNGLLIGTVTIAAYSSIATHWLPAVISAFQRDYPQIHINLLEGIWQEVSQWLDERVADIGFLSYQENMSYDWIPLADDPMPPPWGIRLTQRISKPACGAPTASRPARSACTTRLSSSVGTVSAPTPSTMTRVVPVIGRTKTSS